MNRHRSTPPIRKDTSIAISRDNILYNTESLLEPCVIMFTLWALAFWYEGSLTPPYLILSAVLFYITFPCSSKRHMAGWRVIRNITLSWALLAGLVLVFGVGTGYIDLFPPVVIKLWLWLTPACQLLAVFALRASASVLLKLQGPQKLAIVAGMNDQGIALADSLINNNYSTTACVGFFEDREPDRLNNKNGYPILGKLADIADYVKQHHINVIYLSLPMVSQPRIIKLLDELQDTTASIYILPDIFLTDLIQGRMGQVEGIPVMAICESPFTGINSLVKRFTDIILSLIVLTILSPLLIIICIGVKLSSPGPIIFKQRRYGLDGKEIDVYKFRSMKVSEDSNDVVQAKRKDSRVTRFGAFLRKTSLDEVPQFINVLQGSMSIVGPRPHAVVHNEMYRKLIKGYMIRHKVRPGVTGWAQVNGLRGETETIEKMQARIEHDIDYLRYWSPRLDIYIILRTLWVIIKGQDSAY
jgi:putative colanic acid biosysnthesis UDP-glucose lipid carrier transferase